MLDGVLTKTYPAPPIDEREILRYTGVKGEGDENINSLMRACVKECAPLLSYRVCYRMFSMEQLNALLDVQNSRLCQRALSGCKEGVVFAATVGIGVDRLLRKYEDVSAARALLLQAFGAERIESLCDCFCADLQQELRCAGKSLGQRFSPGYGDFALENQKKIFEVLDCNRKIGLTLTDSLLMTPTKSVTAVIGIGEGIEERKTGCEDCQRTDCEMRRGQK